MDHLATDQSRFFWTSVQDEVALDAAHGEAPALRRGFSVDLDLPYDEALGRLLQCLECQYLSFHLSRAGGDISSAARSAELGPGEFVALMRKHGLLR